MNQIITDITGFGTIEHCDMPGEPADLRVDVDGKSMLDQILKAQYLLVRGARGAGGKILAVDGPPRMIADRRFMVPTEFIEGLSDHNQNFVRPFDRQRQFSFVLPDSAYGEGKGDRVEVRIPVGLAFNMRFGDLITWSGEAEPTLRIVNIVDFIKKDGLISDSQKKIIAEPIDWITLV